MGFKVKETRFIKKPKQENQTQFYPVSPIIYYINEQGRYNH